MLKAGLAHAPPSARGQWVLGPSAWQHDCQFAALGRPPSQYAINDHSVDGALAWNFHSRAIMPHRGQERLELMMKGAAANQAQQGAQ